MRFQVLLSLRSFTSCLCTDKIPEVAKTEVSKPKIYSLSKLRLCHAPLKRLIQITMWKYLHNAAQMFTAKKEDVVSVTTDKAMSGRRCVFLGQSNSTLFGLPKVDALRNH